MNKKEALTELLRDRDLTIQTTENYFPLYSSEESSENHEIVHISVKIPELPFAKVYNTLDIVAPKDVGTQTLDPGYTPLIKDLFSYDFFSDFNIPHLNDTVSFDENNTQTYASDEMQMDFADQEVLGLETPLFNEEFEDTYHCSDYDPASLVDLTTNSSRIIALPFKKTGSDTPVYIPVNFMQNIFGKVGTGAGDSPAEAKIDALYDCIAQYVKLQVVTNSFAMPRIDSDESNEHPDFLNTLAELESVHDEAMVNVAFFDASLGGKYPVVCCAVFGSDEVNRPMLNVAFAANLDLSKAMKKAYLQAMTTILNPYQNTPDCEDEPIFKYRLVYDTSSVMNLQNIEGISLNTGGLLPFEIFMSANSDYPLSTIDRKLTADDEYRTLVEIITREDKSIYFYTFNEEFNVVKAIIPGFSEARDPEFFEEKNSNIGLMYHDFFENLDNNDPETIGEFLESIKDTEIPDDKSVYELLKLPPLSCDVPSALTIGELKALIALAQQDFDAYLYWAEWTLEQNQKSPVNLEIGLHHCLIDYLNHYLSGEEELKNYLSLRELQYDEWTIEEADGHLTGNLKYFYYASDFREYLNSDMYEYLIQLFLAVREANRKDE